MNVRAPAEEFCELDRIGSADWNARATLQVGRVGANSAWWCAVDHRVTLLVGDQDDETWDIAFELPSGLIDEPVTQARRYGGEHSEALL